MLVPHSLFVHGQNISHGFDLTHLYELRPIIANFVPIVTCIQHKSQQ